MYEKLTTVSFQTFKRIKNASKLMMFAGIIQVIMSAISTITYNGPAYEDPTVNSWICSLSGPAFMLNMIMLVIGIIGMVMFASMNHGSNVKRCYKLWCEEHGYAPYNACKR